MSKNSASSINTWFRCPRLWKHTYVDKLEPIDGNGSFEASYGRSFHSLVEGDPDWAGQFGQKWQAVIGTHYDAYKHRWSEKHEQYWNLNFQERELKFQFDLVPGYTYHGIVDGVAELAGKNYLVETKTTGTDIDKFLEYKQHVVQPGLYVLASKHAPELQPFNIQGIIYDVTKRPGIRQKKRPPEPDQDYIERVAQWYFDNKEVAFGRHLIEYTDEQLYNLGSDVMSATDMQAIKAFPCNRDSCYAFRRKCGFYDVCFGEEKLSNTELFQVRKRR